MLSKLNKFPPYLCRAVARKRELPKTNMEIADDSGLSLSTVLRISKMKDWGEVTVAAADAFSRGCGVDLMRPRRHLDWLKRRKHAAWRQNPAFVKRLFQTGNDK